MSTRGLGCHRDVPDARDQRFAAHPAAVGAIPAFASVDVPSIAPKDQQTSSSCVGNAESQAVRLAYLHRGIACPELSALDVYRRARNRDGTAGDEGTQLRSGMAVIASSGLTTEAAWPFDMARVNDQVSLSALRVGYDRHGKRGYHRIAPDVIAEWQAALAAGFPCVAGWDVSEAFCSGSGRGVVDVQQGAIAGGHALAVVAYGSSDHFAQLFHDFKPTKHYPLLFCVLNSWGAEWGYNGRFLASPSFITDATDAWCVDVAPGAAL